MKTNNHRAFRYIIAILLLVAWVGTSARADDVGRCLIAEVPFAAVLPDGQELASGQWRICHRQAYSPTIGLHELTIEGRGLGLFPTFTSDSERTAIFAGEGAAAERPYLIFLRDGEGRLELFSYHRPMDRKVLHHVFREDLSPEIRTHWNAGFEELLDRDDTVILAAR